MFTEIDTRGEVSLWMDTDAGLYLIYVGEHAPIVCDTPEAALEAWRHPYAYIPLGGHRSDPNATEGGSPAPLTPGGELSHRTADALIGLRNVLAEMNVPDFEWTAASVESMIDSLRKWHHSENFTGPPPEPPKPYDQEGDIEF